MDLDILSRLTIFNIACFRLHRSESPLIHDHGILLIPQITILHNNLLLPNLRILNNLRQSNIQNTILQLRRDPINNNEGRCNTSPKTDLALKDTNVLTPLFHNKSLVHILIDTGTVNNTRQMQNRLISIIVNAEIALLSSGK